MDRPSRAQVAVGLFAIAVIVVVFEDSWKTISSGLNDFAPFYVAGELATSESLYEPGPYRDFLVDQFGGTSEVLRYVRLPFYAIVFAPLSALPYELAHAVYIGFRLAAAIGFIALWTWPSRMAAVRAMLICFPFFGALINGQDGPFVLLLLGVSWRMLEQKRGFAAGLALALCSIKFHLFLTLPIWLLARRQQDLWKGFAAGAAALVLISFGLQGWDWPQRYTQLLLEPGISPDALDMPNLHALLLGLPGGGILELLAAVCVATGCWKAANTADWRYGLSVTLLGGLLTSYHAYFVDCMILVPAVITVRAIDAPQWVRTLSLLILLPIPLIAGRPYSLAVQLALVVLFVALVAGAHRHREVREADA